MDAGTESSFVFRATEPGVSPIPDQAYDALRVYSGGDYWNRLVRVYTNFHADNDAFVGGDLQVGAASTLIGVGSTLGSFKVGAGGTVIITTSTGLVGIGTTNPRFTLEVGAVGASGTTLFVNGDARVTGIVTIGPASITLNGISNIINVGSGVTINGSTGTINATSINLGGTTLTGSAVTSITAGSGISVNSSTGNVTITATGGGGGSSQFVTTSAGIHTLSNVGIGTTNPTEKLTVVGVTSSTLFYGDASYTTSGRWILGADGTSNYTFVGIGFTQTTNDPVLYLARGRVYEFVNNSGEVPFNAPNTLYYQCTVHSGMGNTISVYPNTI
jgi:hypothetical protein